MQYNRGFIPLAFFPTTPIPKETYKLMYVPHFLPAIALAQASRAGVFNKGREHFTGVTSHRGVGPSGPEAALRPQTAATNKTWLYNIGMILIVFGRVMKHHN